MIRDLSLWIRSALRLPAGQLAWWVVARKRGRTSHLPRSGGKARRSGAWPRLVKVNEELLGPVTTETMALAERTVARRYRFLNREIMLESEDGTEQYVNLLWTFQLHYLDHGVALTRAWRATGDQRFGEALVRVLGDWTGAASRRSVRLYPYAVSVRSLNLLRILWLAEDLLSPDLADEVLTLVRRQLSWLERNVEYHLMANHLQKNLQALLWGGISFDGEEARRWQAREGEYWNQLHEQVLADGGHFERSPMYHTEALVDYLQTLSLFRATGRPVPDGVEDRLLRMAGALKILSRPDGTLHLFNDAANGQAPHRTVACRLASEVTGREVPEAEGAVALREAGYHAWIDSRIGTRILVDGGAPGPACQPGHAHCDMLSFELDLGGRPVVVDSGVHGYDGDPFREYSRSTRAHNTVAIAGQEQHEVWATFRMARRGDVVSASSEEREGAWRFRGACRHYHDRNALHEREIVLRGEELRVEDRVNGARGARLRSWLHLQPDFEVEEAGDVIVARAPDLEIAIRPHGADSVRIVRGARDPVQGWHFPEFGLAWPAAAIELAVDANDERTFGWTLRRA